MAKLLIGCTAVLAAVALAGCGSGEEATPPATTEPPMTHTMAETEPETQTQATNTEPAPPEPVAIRIVVRDGRPVGGIARPKVKKGDRVVLVVTADMAGDVHLHGYDLERRVTPGAPARIRFEATIPGRFEIELHAHPEVHIGELTVSP